MYLVWNPLWIEEKAGREEDARKMILGVLRIEERTPRCMKKEERERERERQIKNENSIAKIKI